MTRTSVAAAVALVLASFSAAAAVNYVPNPGFESCSGTPASWTPFDTETVSCGASPHGGAGALSLTNATNVGIARAQSACVTIPPSTFLQDFSFSYRTFTMVVYQVALTVDAFTGTDCTGTDGSDSTGVGFQYAQSVVTDGSWHTLTTRTASVDPATHSVRFTASFQLTPASASGTVEFDDLAYATDATSTTTTTLVGGSTTSTTRPTFPGTGKAASECYVTFEGLATTDGHIDCMDGDAACDADGAANGSCTFAFQVCAAEPLAGCQAGTITRITAAPPTLHLPLPAVPTAVPACGDEAQVVVPLARHGRAAGRRTLTFTARSSGKPKQERDRIRLRCIPPA